MLQSHVTSLANYQRDLPFVCTYHFDSIDVIDRISSHKEWFDDFKHLDHKVDSETQLSIMK